MEQNNEFEPCEHPWEYDEYSIDSVEYIPTIYHAMYDKAVELTEREISNKKIHKDAWQKTVDLHVNRMIVLFSDTCSSIVNTCDIKSDNKGDKK